MTSLNNKVLESHIKDVVKKSANKKTTKTTGRYQPRKFRWKWEWSDLNIMFPNIMESVLSYIQHNPDILCNYFLQEFFCSYGLTVSNILNTRFSF